jgi:hypothetical protein
MSADLQNLRDWVTHETGGQARGESTVLLHVTHSNLKARMFEIRLDKHMTIERVKEKLRTHTGTGSLFMHLTLLDFNGQVVADMINEELKLGYFSPMDGWSARPRRAPPPRLESPLAAQPLAHLRTNGARTPSAHASPCAGVLSRARHVARSARSHPHHRSRSTLAGGKRGVGGRLARQEVRDLR